MILLPNFGKYIRSHFNNRWNFSVSDTIYLKEEIRVLRKEVEPKTFRLLVWMLYHRATKDAWELRPF